MVCFRFVIVNTQHESDNKYDDDDDDDDDIKLHTSKMKVLVCYL
jgi:hypothetical protein